MQDQDDPTTDGATAAHKRRWPRRLAAVLGVLVACGFVAWGSFPAWAPALASLFLPDGWRVVEAQVRRPGLRDTALPRLVLEGPMAGMTIRIDASDVQALFSGPELEVRELVVDLVPGSAPTERSAPWSPDDLALPRLLLPGTFPIARVKRLTLNWQGTSPPQTSVFENLAFGEAGGGVNLTAALQAPGILAAPLDLSLVVDATRLVFTAMATQDPSLADSTETSAPPLLRYEERAPAMATEPAESRLDLDFDLALLEASLLRELGATFGLGDDGSAGGRISGSVEFEGIEQLEPGAVDLDLAGLEWQSTRLRAALDTSLTAHREDETIAAVLESFRFRFEGALPGLTDTLHSLASDLGATGLVSSEPIRVAMEGERLDLQLGLDSSLPVGLNGGLSLAWRQDGAVTADLALEDLSARLALAGDAPVVWASTATGTIATNTPIQMDLGDATVSATSTRLAPAGLQLRGDSAFSLEGALGPSTLDGLEWSNPSMAARFAWLQLEGDVGLSETGLRYAGPLNGAALVVAASPDAAAPPLLTAGAMTFTLDLAGDEVIDVSGDGALDGVALPGLGMSLDRVDIGLEALALPALDGRLRLLTTGLEAELDGSVHTGVDLDVNGDLAGGSRFAGDGELLLGYSASLPFAFALDLDAGTGAVQLEQASLPAGGFAAAARALAFPLPKGLAFRDGRLVLDGELRFADAGLAGDLGVRGEALTFVLGESRFEHLDFDTRISLGEALSGGGPLELDLAQLAAGLDLLSLDTTLDIASASDFGALDLEAELLGGQLASPSLRLVDGEIQDGEIRWEGFDLARLLAFIDVGGLTGTGIMDATFPVVAEEGGVAVRGGQFAARAPGRLAYDSGVPATNIGLQALENFQYDNLSGTLDYGSDGSYTIGLDLLGRNPDLYGGHPIRFRLNLGGAMPALFRSLFVTGDFEEAIVERLRAGETPIEETPPTTTPPIREEPRP